MEGIGNTQIEKLNGHGGEGLTATCGTCRDAAVIVVVACANAP